ncbi:MAG: hypothetical protein WA160_14645 [Pseudobdellovibrio sp.]
MIQPKSSIIFVISSVGDERLGSGRINAKQFNPTDRLIAATKKLSLFWLMAILCVFIPVLHFILVPLFLVIGAVSFTKTIKIEGRVLQGQTTCPHCQSIIKIHPGLLAWPLQEICQNCVRMVRITIKP